MILRKSDLANDFIKTAKNMEVSVILASLSSTNERPPFKVTMLPGLWKH